MSELLKKLEQLLLKLDHMGLSVEQILADTHHAILHGDEESARAVVDADEKVDSREVEIERECIQLLARYQPRAIDLRRICFIIKVNNDLERIADLCVSSAKFVKVLRDEGVSMTDYPKYTELCDLVADALHQTIHLFTPHVEDCRRRAGHAIDEVRDMAEGDIELAHHIILHDKTVDRVFKAYLEEVLADYAKLSGNVNALYPLVSLGRSLERVGDLCTNIAEDAIFITTGAIVRHAGMKRAAQGEIPPLPSRDET